jgi:hypothetical protein
MSDMKPQGVFKSPADLKTFHETTDLDLKGVAIFTGALVVVCVATLFGLKMMMNQFAADAADAKARTLPRLIVDAPIVGPRLQADPGRERIEIVKRDLDRLNSYGWVDSKAGTAHIPIDRAMAVLVKSGLPKRGKVDKFHPRAGSSKSTPTQPEAAAEAEPEPAPEAKP